MGRRKRNQEIDIEEACNNWRNSRKRRTKSAHNHHHHVPDDVLMDILCRLPSKSILRFESVCRHWQSLIQDPIFINLHSIQAAKRRDQVEFLQVMYNYPYHYISIDKSGATTIINRISANVKYDEMCTCNGLVCYVADNKAIMVSNPITGETITLPKPTLAHVKRFGIGFGFDTITKKYKVVVSKNLFGSYPKILVFTLGTNSWRNIANSTGFANLLGEKSTYVNGKIYWLTERTDFDYNLLSFNLVDETFSTISLRTIFSYLRDVPLHESYRLCEFEGCLGLNRLPDRHCNTMELFLLKDYGEKSEWTNRQIILPFERRYLQFKAFILSGSIFVQQPGDKTYYNCYVDQSGNVIKTGEIHGLPSHITRAENIVENLVRLSDL